MTKYCTVHDIGAEQSEPVECEREHVLDGHHSCDAPLVRKGFEVLDELHHSIVILITCVSHCRGIRMRSYVNKFNSNKTKSQCS